ncbi:MAG: DUF559 domain-containing protein [Leucobacter sp.]
MARLRSRADEVEGAKGFIEDVVFARAQDYAPLLRAGEAFSHTTALLLLGVPVRCSADLHVTLPRPAGRARGRGVHGHTCATEFRPITVRGLPCAPDTLALVQAAELLNFKELVVALDYILLRRVPRRTRKGFGPASRRGAHISTNLPTPTGLRSPTTPPIPRGARQNLHHATLQLDVELRQFSSRGIRRLRAAFQFARVGAESRMETLLRLELAGIGLDDLDLQVDIYNESHTWIGRFDMVDRERKLIVEYDGEQHRTNRDQYLRDEQRLEEARKAGYQILRVHAEDLHPHIVPTTRERLCNFLDREPRVISQVFANYLAE